MLGIDILLNSALMVSKPYTRFILTIYEICMDSHVMRTYLMGA